MEARSGTGIHRLRVPTPFAVGPVNCYLLAGEPLTLIDTGPNWARSLVALERALAEHQVRIEDLELVAVTHQHIDHTGLLEIVCERSGAALAAHASLSRWLASYAEAIVADDTFAQALMRRHGVPDAVITALGGVASLRHAYGSRAAVSVPLRDGDTITMGGRAWTAHHRPGHSPSDLVFLDANTGTLIGGDHLLAQISSNALESRPPGRDPDAATPEARPRPRPLIEYIASLQATAAMAVDVVLPGHGEPVADHTALITERLQAHRRRAAKILRILDGGPLSAHQIARRMWGELALRQVYLTLSEVLGHLDLLLDDGSVVELAEQPLTRFRKA